MAAKQGLSAGIAEPGATPAGALGASDGGSSSGAHKALGNQQSTSQPALTCQAFCQPEGLLQAVPRRGCRVHHEQVGMPLLLGRSRRSCCECGLLAVQSTQGGCRSCPAGAAASSKQCVQPQHSIREHAEGQCSAGDWRPLRERRRRRQAAALWVGGGDASGGACQLRKLPSVREHAQSAARQRSVRVEPTSRLGAAAAALHYRHELCWPVVEQWQVGSPSN